MKSIDELTISEKLKLFSNEELIKQDGDDHDLLRKMASAIATQQGAMDHEDPDEWLPEARAALYVIRYQEYQTRTVEMFGQIIGFLIALFFAGLLLAAVIYMFTVFYTRGETWPHNWSPDVVEGVSEVWLLIMIVIGVSLLDKTSKPKSF